MKTNFFFFLEAIKVVFYLWKDVQFVFFCVCEVYYSISGTTATTTTTSVPDGTV